MRQRQVMIPDSYTEFRTGNIPPAPSKKVARNLLITCGILFLVYTVLFYPILWTFSILFFVLAYYYNRNMKFEYEYLLYNDDLHIDKVIANLKRKRKFAGDMNKLKLFTNDPDLFNKTKNEIRVEQGRGIHIKRFNNPKEKTYAMLLHTDNGYEGLYLNADEEFINLIKMRHPLAVKMKDEAADSAGQDSKSGK